MLFFAEFDLQFFKTRSELLRHLTKCRLQHPPGDEIYRNRTAKGSVSMYEARALPGCLRRVAMRPCVRCAPRKGVSSCMRLAANLM